MKTWIFASFLMVVLLWASCNTEQENTPKKESTKPSIESTSLKEEMVSQSSIDSDEHIPVQIDICDWDHYMNSLGLVNIQTLDSSLKVELKYSTTDNFMELDVYGCLENCYLQPDVAERLVLCQKKLKEIDSNLSLLLYDGTRPRLIQQYMWDLLDMPIHEKTKFVSNPAKGSLHNFGAAVDITLYDLTLQAPLDMGTPYDYIGVKAWPTKEASMLKDSILTPVQVNNRILLRKVMQEGNFFNIQTEWWHFNACYRDKAKELYHLVEGDTNLIKNLKL